MDFQTLLDSINPEIYENLKTAIEIGKWPDGRILTGEQREMCMQAVIAYEHKHMTPEERTGYVPPKPKKEEPCGTDKSKGEISEPEDQPLKWQH